MRRVRALPVALSALLGLVIVLALTMILTGCAGTVNGKAALEVKRTTLSTVSVTARVSGTLVIASSRAIGGALHPLCERRDTSNGPATGLRCEILEPSVTVTLETLGKVSAQIVRGIIPVTLPTPEEPPS